MRQLLASNFFINKNYQIKYAPVESGSCNSKEKNFFAEPVEDSDNNAIVRDDEMEGLSDEVNFRRIDHCKKRQLLLLLFFCAVVSVVFSFYSKAISPELEKHKEVDKHQTLSPLRYNISYVRAMNNNRLPLMSDFGTRNQLDICRGKDEKRCVQKFGGDEARRSLAEFFTIGPKANSVACLIQKNMSSVLRAFFCYLFDQCGYMNAHKLAPFDSYCEMKNIAASLDDLNRTFSSITNETTLIVIVRDPVKRLVSGFLDKCVGKAMKCNGCRANLTCFVLAEYEKLMSFSTKENPKSENKSYDIAQNIHFFPQNWRCDFSHLLSRYQLIHHETDSPNFKIYKAANAAAKLLSMLRNSPGGNLTAEDIRYIEKNLVENVMAHSTLNLETRHFLERLLVQSPFLMEYVVRMFYWDYILFNYPLPEISFNNETEAVK